MKIIPSNKQELLDLIIKTNQEYKNTKETKYWSRYNRYVKRYKSLFNEYPDMSILLKPKNLSGIEKELLLIKMDDNAKQNNFKINDKTTVISPKITYSKCNNCKKDLINEKYTNLELLNSKIVLCKECSKKYSNVFKLD